MLGCHVQHELRHSGRDSRTCAMARRVWQRVSAVRALILAGTEDARWEVSHRRDKGKSRRDLDFGG
jgi:hypothetical protein